MRSSEAPSASSAVQPKIRSAAAFQKQIVPAVSAMTTASAKSTTSRASTASASGGVSSMALCPLARSVVVESFDLAPLVDVERHLGHRFVVVEVDANHVLTGLLAVPRQ